ncbi:nucleoside hydrolase [Natranaerobius thermophilus]|uniref:Inosine/uridine-preferring nucleoside hydrolase n=1 Tax=Natranaerobius thermophilus (strain ATCC BAA-1301 / DSM 18059 / JW/NM-WN-LF) TaxID=457570 RepID=B2A8I9_NATTJ|nr:nucleoside hydrolase [Natranaerobius thermophilus]ACB85873.1 Inosine/uridine-preferring nucleoside hydrolase [Natranaerobius thermophilus JW/NM-WN-LF]
MKAKNYISGNRKPVILDTDPGMDDAIALFFLMGRQDILEPVAITTVFGNVSIDKTTHNAQKLLKFLDAEEVPVYRGASSPLIRDRVSGEMIHGESGLGEVDFPEPEKSSDATSTPAAVAMAKEIMARPGEITVITVGPMTNLALALKLYPEIKEQIAEVIVMGGAMGQGNRTASAEYNVFADPHSAQIVFESGLSVAMIGLDVTEQSKPGQKERQLLQKLDHPVATKTLEFMDFFKRQMKTDYDMAFHDPCAIAYAINPDIFTTRSMDVRIELTGTYTLGRTVCSRGQEEVKGVMGDPDSRNVKVGLGVDREKFFEELFTSFRKLADTMN